MAQPLTELVARPLLLPLLLQVWSILAATCLGLGLVGVLAGSLLGLLLWGWLRRRAGLSPVPGTGAASGFLPALLLCLCLLLLAGATARRIGRRRAAARAGAVILTGCRQPLRLRARVASFPEPGRRGWSLKLEPRCVEPALPAGGFIRLYLPPLAYDDFRLPRYGDLIEVAVRLRPLRPARHPFLRGGLRRLLLAGYVATGRLEDLGRLRLLARRPNPIALFDGWRRRLYRSIFAALGERHRDGAAILAAVLLGCRDRLRPEVRNLFLDFGVFHLFAVSGLHLGVVAGLVFWLVRYLLPVHLSRRLAYGSLRPAALASLCFLPLYLLLAGFRLPVLRAGIMAALFLLGLLSGGRRDLFSTLLLAALVILWLWPGSLFGLSFQLSFSAVAVIIWLLPRLERWGTFRGMAAGSSWRRRAGRALFSGSVISFAITLAGAPILLAKVHFLSLASLPANLLLVPLFSLLLIPWGLAALFLFFIPPFFRILLLPPALLLEALLRAGLGLREALPGLRWYGPVPTGTEMALFYAALLSGAFILSWPCCRRRAILGWLLLLGAILAAVEGGYRWRWRRPELHLAAFVGGRPQSLLVEVPGGEALLFNGGSWAGSRPGDLERAAAAGRFSLAEQVIAPYCWRRRIRRIPILVLSEPQRGRLGGLLFLVKHFGVREIWYHGVWCAFAPFREFNRITRARFGVRWRKLTALAAPWSFNGVEIVPVGPPANPPSSAACGARPLKRLAPSLLLVFRGRRVLVWSGGGLQGALLPEQVDILAMLASPVGRPAAKVLGALRLCPGGVVLTAGGVPPAAELEKLFGALAGIRCRRVDRDGFLFFTLPLSGPVGERLPAELISGCQMRLE